MGKLEQNFNNPEAQYRIVPFWFWNGDMNDEQISKQLKEMADKGLGGVFICARQGLELPYLSKLWFDKVSYAAQVAQQYGLQVWLYDEYPYPSGMSGGEVLLQHPEAEHTLLDIQSFEASGEVDVHLPWAKILYANAVRIDENGKLDRNTSIDLTDYIGNYQEQEIYQQTGLTAYNNKRFFTYGPKKQLHCVLPGGEWKIELFMQKPLGDFKYYGGFFDPFNKEAVRTFIETTHKKYKKYIGQEFGKNIKGMFSDEVGPLGSFPWSNQLPKYFYNRNGYDIIENLPALLDDNIENAYKIRYDFYQTAHELFTESYHKQVADWCSDNDLMLATEVPSLRMSTQRYSHVIGGDTAHEKLGKSLEWIYDRYIHNYRSNAKSISSLARQLDKKYSMVEAFHSVGWSMTLQDAKWMIDRLGASGINLYNFHAFYYTIDSITKHDAPPSQFLQNPYWKHYKLLADYVGRMSKLVSDTVSSCNVAVLDPVVSFWTHLSRPVGTFKYALKDEEGKNKLEKLVEDWVHICKTILFNQLDYEHLDVEILEQAQIQDGKLRLGKALYEVLILPPTSAIEQKGTKKLQQFIEAGGKVIALGMLPYQVIDQAADVEKTYKALFNAAKYDKNDYWDETAGNIELYQYKNAYFINTKTSILKADIEELFIGLYKNFSQPKIEFQIEEKYKKSFITSIRTDADGNDFVLVCNQAVEAATGMLIVNSDTCYGAQTYSLEDGSITPLPMNDNKLPLTFGPYESKLIKLSEGEITALEKKDSHITIDTSKPMPVAIDGANLLRFEKLQISADRQNWTATEVKTFIEQYSKLDSWSNNNLKFDGMFGTPKKISLKYPITVYYKIEFELDVIAENLSILLDRRTVAGSYTMYVNGLLFKASDFTSIFVNDQNNRICNIAKAAKLGNNQVVFEVALEKDSDGFRDNVYVYGDFSVLQKDQHWHITEKQATATVSNSYIEGFPFYSGTFTYETAFSVELEKMLDTFVLDFDFKDTIYDCIEVIVNGQSLGVRAFTPYQWNGSKALLKQTNKVVIKITNTLANMLDGTYFDYKAHTLVPITPK